MVHGFMCLIFSSALSLQCLNNRFYIPTVFHIRNKYGIRSFHDNCLHGLKPNLKGIQRHVDNTLMKVTALNPHIGYDKAAAIAKRAHQDGLTLKEAAVRMGILTEEQFDKFLKIEDMV